jgi:hypothetical protein
MRPCQTCGLNMTSLGYADGGTIWWCSRCGSVNHHNQFTDAPPIELEPKLIARCQMLEEKLFNALPKRLNAITVIELLDVAGITESIHLPSKQKTETIPIAAITRAGAEAAHEAG